MAAAFNAADQVQAAGLPALGLTGSLGGASTDLAHLLNPANLAWSVGTRLLAPLFNSGQQENIAIATAEQEAALAEYAAAALQAFTDVEAALDQGSVLAERFTVLQEAAAEAAEAYRIADLRYQEGETSLVDLLAIQQRVINTRSGLTAVQRLQLQQWVTLNLALGGDWE